MPFGDGTGPTGQGPATGRSIGIGIGSGRGRMGGNRAGAGSAGYCACTQCGTKVPHQRGTPCYSMICPKCGTPMTRG